MDGKPFVIRSGEMHYFRHHPAQWEDRILKLKAMGLNTISTYVSWNLHEPERGVFNWEGLGDIQQFLEICKKHEMYVLMRPGPYICAEWEFGALPYWILENENIKIRTSDPAWLKEITEWYAVFMLKIKPYLYSQSGTILLVQVENEYGSYPACDHAYLHWLYNETVKYTGYDVVIYTTDGGSAGFLKCGAIEEAYAAVDFGAGDCTGPFNAQRQYQKRGPNMNSEYYPGWLSHWGEKFPHTEAAPVVRTMRQMLDVGASFNFYMAIGGTNFGFYNGANGGGNNIQVDTTSYDYDAPLTEAGDTTLKFLAIREALKDYEPNIPATIPPNVTKAAYGDIKFTQSALLFQNLDKLVKYTKENETPLNFEQVKTAYGYVLYSTVLKGTAKKTLNIGTIRDFVLVYVNDEYLGFTYRQQSGKDFDLGTREGTLYLLVENMGRINYGADMTDRKGIRNVKINGAPVVGWKMQSMPMIDISGVEYKQQIFTKGPAFYKGTFEITGEPHDTWFDIRGWLKGHVVVNGFNIGKYWEPGPPQHALYVPGPILKKGTNEVIIFEQDRVASSNKVVSIDYPILDY